MIDHRHTVSLARAARRLASAAALLLLVPGPSVAIADDVLAEQVRFALEGAGVDVSAVRVEESDGIVTLSGTVENARIRESVIDAASRTHGVVDVVDAIDTDY